MKKISLTALAFVMLFVFMTIVHAQSANPKETLKQYISDLQKNPNDTVLREKIITLVQKMKRKPAIPEEARGYFIEGNTLLKAAKDQKGYGLALDDYRQCLLIAPWWADAYYNYSVALDLANQFDEAATVLKLYIATNPGEEESRKAQDKIYEIDAQKKLAAQKKEESSPRPSPRGSRASSKTYLRKLMAEGTFTRLRAWTGMHRQ
jgi:tetratricopeptide (TPR) repeat protein